MGCELMLADDWEVVLVLFNGPWLPSADAIAAVVPHTVIFIIETDKSLNLQQYVMALFQFEVSNNSVVRI